MNDSLINVSLALAIGYAKHDVFLRPCGEVLVNTGKILEVTWSSWRVFDYKDPCVIWPIAEKYSCFPSAISSGNFKKAKSQGYDDIQGWEVFMFDYKTGTEQHGKWVHTYASTAAETVALAVIGSTK